MGRKITTNNDMWADWLRDEPVQQEHDTLESGSSTNHQIRVHSPTQGQSQVSSAMATSLPIAESQSGPSVSIQIQVPSISRPAWMRLPHVTKSQVRYWSLFVIIVLSVALAARYGTQLITDRFFTATSGPVAGSSSATENASVDFNPVVPQDKKQLAEQGDSAGKYDPSKKLYSYNDTNLGANLTISQQPLPDAFKKNPSEITKAADSINAKHKITTAMGDAYLFTEEVEKGGTQRIVFAYRDMLVFVQSNKKLADDAWKFYIENLR